MNSFLIRGVRLFDGDNVTEKTNVLVRDGLIAGIGPDLQADADAGIPVLDRAGHTLLPGLIDGHSHPEDQVEWPEQALRFGITTLVDLHNRSADKQKRWARERKDVPDSKSAHSGATIENGWPAAIVKQVGGPEASDFDNWPNIRSEADVQPYMDGAIAAGADLIKLFHERGKAVGLPEGALNQPSAAVQAALVQAAHAEKLKVVAHAMALQDTLEMLRAGVDGLAHTVFDAPVTDEVVALYAHKGTWLNPTLACIGVLTGESLAMQQMLARDERVASRISEEQRVQFTTPLRMAEEGAQWEFAIDSVRRLKEAGVRIIAGSDSAPGLAVIFGASLHLELHCLVHKAGLSPLEALRSATSTTARCFGWDDRGVVEAGRKADLLLVEGNPAEDIADLLNIRGIWRDGVEFKGHEGFPREL